MKKKINVLIISKQYPPAIGGGGAYSYYLANSLSLKQNINVNVITSHFETLYSEQKIKNKNLTIHRIKFEHSLALPYESAIEKCMDLFNKDKIKPDLIHAQHITGTYVGMHLSSSFNIPLICTLHKTPIQWDNSIIKRSPLYSHLKLLTNVESINIFIAGSEIFKKELLKLGVKREKIRFVYHGVPINILQRLAYGKKKIQSVINKLNLSEKEILIVCPSRIDKRKQLEVFINAVGLLQNELKDFRFKFLITGEPNDPSQKKQVEILLEIAEVYGIQDQLIFKSFEFEEIPALFSLAKVCILPSTREGLGLVVLESLAIPTPVIVSQGTGVNEIIKRNGTHGLCFLAGDHVDLNRQ
jgi:glycosyltransferase involved in cell wall biosynthesis